MIHRFDYDDYELGLAVDGVDDGLPLVEAPSGGDGPNLQGRFDEYEDFGRISENSSSSSSNSRNSRRYNFSRNGKRSRFRGPDFQTSFS